MSIPAACTEYFNLGYVAVLPVNCHSVLVFLILLVIYYEYSICFVTACLYLKRGGTLTIFT